MVVLRVLLVLALAVFGARAQHDEGHLGVTVGPDGSEQAAPGGELSDDDYLQLLAQHSELATKYTQEVREYMREWGSAARDHALLQGTEYLASLASQNFIAHARDYMLGFALFRKCTAADVVQERVGQVGRELARVWGKSVEAVYPEVVEWAQASGGDGGGNARREPAFWERVRMLVGDVFNAERLGVEVPWRDALLQRVQAEARFEDFFPLFPDPVSSMPSPPVSPEDALRILEVEGVPPQPDTVQLLEASAEIGKWQTWQNALIFAFVVERMGVRVGGVGYADVLKHLPLLRPYQPDAAKLAQMSPMRRQLEDTLSYLKISIITHVIYTLSDYDFLDLSHVRHLLQPEADYLLEMLPTLVNQYQSVEAVGEAVDCLKTLGYDSVDDATAEAAGLTHSDVVAQAESFLLRSQNQDGGWGSWAEIQQDAAYHTTIVAMWGLRDHSMTHRPGPVFGEAVLDALRQPPS